MDNLALRSSQARLSRTQARERGLTRTWLDSVAPWRLGKSVYNYEKDLRRTTSLVHRALDHLQRHDESSMDVPDSALKQ